MEYPKFKVCCRCFTFNHSKYITDAMNGFTMQQTSFPFVCTIVDDASTDGEQEVIRKYVEENFDFSVGSVSYHKETDYAHITYAQHKTNKNCYFVAILLKTNHNGAPELKAKKYEYIKKWRVQSEYEAICEGDDYWIDEFKIQKQADFLDSHPDFGLVYSGFRTSLGECSNNGINHKKNGNYFPYILWEAFNICTCTVLLRISVLAKCPQYSIEKRWPMGDYPLWIEMAHLSKFGYINEVTSVYRVLPHSASHSSDMNRNIRFADASIEIKKFYAELYDVVLPQGWDISYYYYIIRYAYKLHDKKIAEEYYQKAKAANKRSLKLCLFYYGTKYTIIRKLLSTIIKD